MLIGRRLTFLTRAGCGLCDEAYARLEGALRFLPIDLEIVDIEADRDLEREYHLRIPVVLDRNGRVVAEGQIGRLDTIKAVFLALF